MWYQGRMSGVYSELKRRNVFRVAIAYVLVAWVVLQIADVLFPALSLPSWTVRFVVGLLILGFPLALVFAWAFELTPEGLKLERDVDRTKSITRQSARKLDRVVIAVLAVALALFALDKFAWDAGEPAVVSIGSDKSIAVLPFVNMSDDSANEYFSDGVSEELLNLLAKIPDLRVIGRTSSFQFKGRNEDLRVIGETLGVTNILEGSVRKSNNKVRITAQLISAEDGAHLWSETYDRDLDDVFGIQDEIAAAVVNALRVELLGESIPTHLGTSSTAAYDVYLKGLYHHRKYTPADLETALRYYEEALEFDPTLADAWQGKGSVYLNQTFDGSLPLSRGTSMSRDALARALELNPEAANSLYLMGFLQTTSDWDWEGARASMEGVLAIEPNHSGALSGMALLSAAVDRFDEAIEYSSRSILVDPFRLASRHNHGLIYYKAGRIDEAVPALRDAVDYGPNLTRNHYRYALALLAAGDAEAALAAVEQEKGEQWRLAGKAIIHAAIGNSEEADAALAELTERFAENASYVIAKAHAVRGEVDEAFHWFDIAWERRDPLMPFIRDDPGLDSVRADPRFVELLDRLKLPR